jgi:hypothetical protein
MSMPPISYLSRLAEGGGDRRFLTPPRVLFRPVLPSNAGFSEIEPVIGSSPTTTRNADRMVSMKSSQTGSAKVLDSSASALPVVFSTTPQLLMAQSPAQVPPLTDEAPDGTQVKQSLHHAMDTGSAIMRPTRSIGPQPRRTNFLNLEPAPGATEIIKEVNRPSTRTAEDSALDSIIDKTMDTEQTRITPSQPVVPGRGPQRQATAVIENGGRPAASIQEDAGTKQRSSMSSGSETGHSRRIFLTPTPIPAASERATHRPEKREKAGSGSSPAIHIGTLEVRISPPEMPQRTVPKKSSVLHPTSPLAQGFRSFGLAQG